MHNVYLGMQSKKQAVIYVNFLIRILIINTELHIIFENYKDKKICEQQLSFSCAA